MLTAGEHDGDASEESWRSSCSAVEAQRPQRRVRPRPMIYEEMAWSRPISRGRMSRRGVVTLPDHVNSGLKQARTKIAAEE